MIEMSARAVASFREPFSPTGMRFYDAGVALDEIASLTGNIEPVVLRVRASGGSKGDRAAVSGDWLCSDHLPPARVPPADWRFSELAGAWAEGRPWLDAWEGCDNAEWMLVAAAESGVEPRSIIRAACACVRSAMHLVPPGEMRPLKAVEAAESFDADAASDAQRNGLAAAHEGAVEAVHARDPSVDGVPAVAAMSAASIAALCAVQYASGAAYFGDAAGGAAFNAALALEPYNPGGPLRYMSSTVRGAVATEAVLRAAAGRVSPGRRRTSRRR